jgi:hypothetical protein
MPEWNIRSKAIGLLYAISFGYIDQIPQKDIESRYWRYLEKRIIEIGERNPEIEMVEVKAGVYMRKRFPFLDQVYWGSDGVWSIE